MKLIFLLSALFLSSQANLILAQDTTGASLSSKIFERKINKKSAIVLDVRTPEEYSVGYIPKSINYNFKDSLNFVQAIQSLDKNKKYFLYCASGRRSGKALVMMKQMGFTKIHHLAGGITNWKGDIKKPG